MVQYKDKTVALASGAGKGIGLSNHEGSRSARRHRARRVAQPRAWGDGREEPGQDEKIWRESFCLANTISGSQETAGLQLERIVSGVFTPVLARHSKSFALTECIGGVDRVQRNLEPMRKQVEAWQQSELSDGNFLPWLAPVRATLDTVACAQTISDFVTKSSFKLTCCKNLLMSVAKIPCAVSLLRRCGMHA